MGGLSGSVPYTEPLVSGGCGDTLDRPALPKRKETEQSTVTFGKQGGGGG